MLDWLIIGGGIHGTHLSLFLTRRKQVSPDRLRVLDPYPQALTLWEHHTDNTGMAFLRSPHAHNLHYDPFSLVTFARVQRSDPSHFIPTYGRPSLDLFRAHSAHLMDRYHLNTLRLTGRAHGLMRLSDGWRVGTADGGIESRRVILAMGNTENPFWPDWALTLRADNAPVHHIFGAGFNRAALPPWEHAIVVGGGITAVQIALAMATTQPGAVTLLMRHAPRIHNFDSDPVWIDRHHLTDFHATDDYSVRRAIIREARHRGSMPPDVAADLRSALENGLLNLHEDSVVGVRSIASAGEHPDHIELNLLGGDVLQTDCLVLATGFLPTRPGGQWLDQAVTDYDLPIAPDGFPIVDPSLCWADGLYVTGPLAELEVGPTARNFIGARLAAERIGASL
jgi:cation diffusion facilitator CzcD-associated flavoprotein CzcO